MRALCYSYWRVASVLALLTCTSVVFGSIDDDFDLSFLLDAPTEAVALSDLENYVKSGGTLNGVSGKALIEGAMGKGWWDLTTRIVKVGDDFEIDLSSAVHQTGTCASIACPGFPTC
jgi:hypothetical protein